MHFITNIVVLLITLSILVIAHEWGHFIVARIFGIRVDDFSIGFGKRLIRVAKRGDTEYNIRMLPLGGFVKIAGMDPDEEPLIRAKDKILKRPVNNDPDAGELPLLAENTPEHDEDPDKALAPDGFYSKPLWQRSLVIFAGPLMSFILGYVAFCLMGVTVGVPTGKTLTKVDTVLVGGEGHRIGLRANDVIQSINGVKMVDGDQMVDYVHGSLGKPLILVIQRGTQTLTLKGTPRPLLDADNKPIVQVKVKDPGALGKIIQLKEGDQIGGVGQTPVANADQALDLLRKAAGGPVEVTVLRNHEPETLKGTLPSGIVQPLPQLSNIQIGGLKFAPTFELKHLSFAESWKAGNQITIGLFKALGDLVRRNQLHKNVGGMISMYHATDDAVQSDHRLEKAVENLAQISISLAIFNLLPIPILDGGHLLSFFIEWVRRGKRLTEQQQQAFLMTGLAIIGILFVLITGKDILATIHHQFPQ